MDMISVSNSDKHTFEQINNDDENAFKFLFEKYYIPLCRYVYTFTKDNEESEEITQEVFINIWNNRKKISITTSVSSYLYSSVRNHAINSLKKNSRYNTQSLENITELEIANEEPELDEFQFIQMEKKCSEALESLPDRCREVFLLSRIDNLKYKEIAEQLNISIKTVESQMSIAIKKLKDVVQP